MLFLRMMFAFALTAAAACAGDVVDQSTTDSSGGRVLSQSIVIDAPVAKVWTAMMDPAAIMRWSTPFAAVDLRQGGSYEVGFDKASKPGDPNNIRHEIVGYMPERFLIMRNTNSPAGLPGREEFKQILEVVQFDPVSESKTRFTVTHIGYGSGPAWDALHHFFATHNPEYMLSLKAAAEKP